MNEEEELLEIKESLKTAELQVPLVVKQNNNNNKRIRHKKEKDKKVSDGKISNAILLCIIALLLLITSYVIIGRIIESNNKTVIADNSNIKQYTFLKKWISADNELFAFEDNKEFYWYKDKSNTNNDYYTGSYTYKKGEEALKEMGYTKKDFISMFNTKIEEENIYSLELEPDTAYMDGIDQTDKYIPRNTKWWFILIIKSDGTAIAYNKTLDIRYHLK